MPERQEETIRVHQANERTMLAWVRTGIALMAFGFAIARFGVFLREVASMGLVAARATKGVGSAIVGIALVALGMLANFFATLRYAQVRRRIELGQLGPPPALMVYLFGATLTLVGALMTVLLARALGD
jgi:putative membrane protein